MQLIFITADPTHAKLADQAGVDRIMVDLEIIGKDARQGHLNTVISRHTLDDVVTIKSALKNAELLVRINPWEQQRSPAEIDSVIAAGAQRLMLPMFKHSDEVREFLNYVNGRVPTILLLETGAALSRLPEILKVPNVEEIHIGLNDLHLDLQLDFMFELFPSKLLDHAAQLIHDANVRLGIGGVARLGQGLLSAQTILSEHTRIGSRGVILSRDFVQAMEPDGDFCGEVARLRAHLEGLKKSSPEDLQNTRTSAAETVLEIARKIRGKREKST